MQNDAAPSVTAHGHADPLGQSCIGGHTYQLGCSWTRDKGIHAKGRFKEMKLLGSLNRNSRVWLINSLDDNHSKISTFLMVTLWPQLHQASHKQDNIQKQDEMSAVLASL